MNKICYGCGVKLQSENKDKLGYIPESKKEDAKYCMRCFRMMHYGEKNQTNTPKDVKEIVNKMKKRVIVLNEGKIVQDYERGKYYEVV